MEGLLWPVLECSSFVLGVFAGHIGFHPISRFCGAHDLMEYFIGMAVSKTNDILQLGTTGGPWRLVLSPTEGVQIGFLCHNMTDNLGGPALFMETVYFLLTCHVPSMVICNRLHQIRSRCAIVCQATLSRGSRLLCHVGWLRNSLGHLQTSPVTGTLCWSFYN